MKRIKYIIIALLFSGCSDFLKEYSQDLVVAKSVSDLDEVLLGSGYMPSIEIKTIGANNLVCPWLNMLDDNVNTVRNYMTGVGALTTWESRKSMFGYVTWQYEVGRNINGNAKADDDNAWNDLYRRINVVNVILAEMEEMGLNNDLDRTNSIRVKGECHFLRAQFYLLLVNIYANAYTKETAATTLGVPLKLTGYVEHDKDKTPQFDRAPVAEVYAQIVEDLKLSISYLTQSPQKRPLHRASKEAAQLLLSRVYLYMQDWKNAREAAGEFLKSKNTLAEMNQSDAEEPFLSKENSEVIFSQGPLNLQSILTAEVGDFCITSDLYNLYDTTDFRKTTFFGKNTRSDSISLSRKFRTGVHISHISDVFGLRTAEGFLNMAEACAMLGDADANNWLTQLRRTRIKNYQPVSYSGRELIDQVRLERRKELCFEGHRWFDLRRYAVNTAASFKKQITHEFVVYSDNNRLFYDYTFVFTLLEDDPAYTFRIPDSVLEFDKGMPDNPREKREQEKLKEPEEPEEPEI